MTGQSAFEEIARGYYLEALLIDGDTVWYTDVTQGGIRCVGAAEPVLRERMMIGGLLRNDTGHILVAGDDGIVAVNPETGSTEALVQGIGGVNEMRGDGRGGMVFGTIDLASILLGKAPEPSAIWHLSVERTLTKIKHGLTFANGLAVSSDGKTLFFNESFSGVRAYAFNGPSPLGDPLWAIDKPDCDGMALDAAGNIWVTGFASDHVLCLSPDGTEIQRQQVPGAACTNIRFGGTDLRTLYLCVVDQAGTQALKDGQPILEQNSVLVRCHSPVVGAALDDTQFRF
jgi:sugar lactone lactonase YvrE